uniref:Uncharacterized protein n=1 Tax=Rhizophora mucronata TaxID=61149 RepID=A0A2P2PUJ9_RHIMU
MCLTDAVFLFKGLLFTRLHFKMNLNEP